MTIKVTCPNGHKLAAKDEKAGTVVRCPACGTKLRVPQPASKGCSNSAVLRILGFGESTRRARAESGDSARVSETHLADAAFKQSVFKQAKNTIPAKSTQICPQCDWEIDTDYRVCPHCHFYLMDNHNR